MSSCTPKRKDRSKSEQSANLVSKAVIIHSTQQLYDYVQSMDPRAASQLGIRCLHSSIVSGYPHVIELYNRSEGQINVPKLFICESTTHKYKIIDNIYRLLNPNYSSSQRTLTRLNIKIKETKNLTPGNTYYYEFYIDGILFAQSQKKTIHRNFSDVDGVSTYSYSASSGYSSSNKNLIYNITVDRNSNNGGGQTLNNIQQTNNNQESSSSSHFLPLSQNSETNMSSSPQLSRKMGFYGKDTSKPPNLVTSGAESENCDAQSSDHTIMTNSGHNHNPTSATSQLMVSPLRIDQTGPRDSKFSHFSLTQQIQKLNQSISNLHSEDNDGSILWSEDYMFDHLPVFKTLKIKLYETKKKRSKAHSLGYHKFDFQNDLLQNNNSSNFYDEWTPFDYKSDNISVSNLHFPIYKGGLGSRTTSKTTAH